MNYTIKQSIDLLSYFGEFSELHPEDNLEDFADWLSERVKQKNNEVALVSEFSELPFTPEKPHLDEYISHLLGRLARFAILWSKKMFEDVPIRTMEEYGILMIIARSPNINKSDIAYQSLFETTTCLEIIKRLRRMELLVEEPDETDRRSRKVSLTKAGQVLVKQCEQQLIDFSRLMVGQLSKEEKEALAGAFGKLNGFHGKIYAQHRDATLEQIIATYLASHNSN